MAGSNEASRTRSVVLQPLLEARMYLSLGDRMDLLEGIEGHLRIAEMF